MTILEQIKQGKYEKETKKFPLLKYGDKLKIDLEEKVTREERMRPKACTFASNHP
jgi:hypothetical protein